MIDKTTLEQLAESISQQVPAGFNKFKDQAAAQVQTLLLQQLDKLDLVTREEFDTQNAVLLRNREKLDELEKTVANLISK